MTLGNTISKYRKALGITQEALAQQLEVTNQAVSKWESDQCCPDVMLLPRLADLFGITIDELFEHILAVVSAAGHGTLDGSVGGAAAAVVGTIVHMVFLPVK